MVGTNLALAMVVHEEGAMAGRNMAEKLEATSSDMTFTLE